VGLRLERRAGFDQRVQRFLAAVRGPHRGEQVAEAGLFLDPGHQLGQQLGLGGEVQVHGLAADAGASADLAQAGVVAALLGQRPGGGEDPLPSVHGPS